MPLKRCSKLITLGSTELIDLSMKSLSLALMNKL